MTNNDDPKEFTLEITRMRDIRQRIGIIEAGLLLTASCVACVRAGRVVRDHGEDGRRGEHAEHENLR